MEIFLCKRENNQVYCGNCMHQCKMDVDDPQYYYGCRSWGPDRGCHPDIPNPCEIGQYNGLPYVDEDCLNCPNVIAINQG